MDIDLSNASAGIKTQLVRAAWPPASAVMVDGSRVVFDTDTGRVVVILPNNGGRKLVPRKLYRPEFAEVAADADLEIEVEAGEEIGLEAAVAADADPPPAVPSE
jgi:hypothetical protein